MGTRNQTSAQGTAATVRGSAVPFTAPSLFGVRARHTGRSLELLLPNPSGGRGVYVMKWAMVSDAVLPSLHDAVLGKALSELGELNPAAVRSTAREVAAAGYAGRAARNAAVGIQDRMAKAITELWRDLATGMATDSALPAEQTRRLIEGLTGAQTASSGLDALAARLNWQATVLAEALARLARHYVGVTDRGRAAVLLRRAAELRRGLGDAGTDPAPGPGGSGDRGAGSGQVVAELDQFLAQARQAVDAARAMINSPGRLLAVWRGDPARALAPAERVETLFDGWERILALWAEPDDATAAGNKEIPADAALLMRLAAANLVGAVPVAGGGRTGNAARPYDPSAASRTVRNERVRAAELLLEHGNG